MKGGSIFSVGKIVTGKLCLFLLIAACLSTVGSLMARAEADTAPPFANILSFVHTDGINDRIFFDIYDLGGGAIASAKLYRDGEYVLDIPSPYDAATYDTSALADGTYRLEVVVADTSGNVATSTPYSMTLNSDPPPADIDPPQVRILSINNNKIYTDIYDVGVAGIARVELYIDGTLSQTITPPAAYDLIITDSSSLADGSHQVIVSAEDNVGNRASSSPWTMIIDQNGPSVIIDPLADYLSALNLISGTAADDISGLATVDLLIENLSSHQFWNGSAWQDGQTYLTVELGDDDFSFDGSTVTWQSASQYEITARATDNRSNSAVSAETFTFDNLAPTVTDNIPARRQSADVTVTLGCTDDASGCDKVFYTADSSDPSIGSSYISLSDNWRFTVTSNGSYTIKYRGLDAAGNLGEVRTAANVLQISKSSGGGEVWTPPAPPSTTTPTSTPTTTTEPGLDDSTEIDASGQVLGVKTYGDGVLLRGPDFKIYALKNGGRYYIGSLAQLWNYRTWKSYNVSAEVIAAYEDFTGRIYGPDVLIRGRDFKIYSINAEMKKHHISDLIELRQYQGRRIYRGVSGAIINLYPSI